MELRQLRQFLVLARTLNFHRAANELNIAQPPLSVSISKLEDELKAKLFERHHRGVRLTAAGEAALPLAEQAVTSADEIREVVSAVTDGKRGQVRVGFVGSACYSLIPQLASSFRSTLPAVDLVLEEARVADCLRGVEANSLDLGIVRTPLAEVTPLDSMPLERTELVVAVAADHRLADEQVIRLESLADETFIYFDRKAAGMWSLFLLSCQNAGFLPKIAHTGAQLQTVLSLASMGIGVALVPKIEGVRPDVRLVPLTCNNERIPVGLSLVRRHRDTSPLVAHFWKLAQLLAVDQKAAR